MDTLMCREQIATLLTEEERLLSELQKLLQAEHDAIVANDLATLDERGEARSRLSGALLKLQDERRSMLTMLRYSPTPEGLEQLLRWCDPDSTLQARWRRCAALAEQGRQSNERNGMLVQARLRRIEGMLEVITASPPASTYDRDAARGGHMAGRLLSAEA